MAFKRKLTPRRKGGHKFVSKGRTHKESHVRRSNLDSMLMPKYKCRFDGNGINTAIWTSRKLLDDGAYAGTSGTTSNQVGNRMKSEGGDWDAFQCLPGRQCYMEFTCLPMFSPNDVDSSVSSLFGSKLYKGHEMNFGRLVAEAFKNNNIYMFEDNAYNSGISPDEGDMLYNLFTAGYYNFFAPGTTGQWNYRGRTYDQIMNTVVHYQGGKQTHRFTNQTSLPVYMEFVEYSPKDMMPMTVHVGDIDAANVASKQYAIPGLYETIMEDRWYQMVYHKRLNPDGGPGAVNGAIGDSSASNNNLDIRAGFNELDDKDFKLKGKMYLTEMRFNLGKPKRVRVDPGQTFTYELVMKPWSRSLRHMFRLMYLSLSMNHVNNAPINEWKRFGTNGPFFLHELVSKGLQVRCWGSTAYATTGTAAASYAGNGVNLRQFNSYANTEVNMGLIGGTDKDGITPNINGVKAVASHAVLMTHSVSEYHEVRVQPFFRSSNYVRYNTRANAYNPADLVLGDDMRTINPETLETDEVEGDGDDVMT